MRRLSNEDGREAGARNWGRFALFLIPLVLGIAASIWLGVYIGTHRFNRELSQEDRAANAVGAEVRPTDKITFDLKKNQKHCAPVTRADLDGKTMRLYATNNCGVELTGMDWWYALVSPDGTILHDGYMNQRTSTCPAPRFPNDKSECVFAGTSGGYIEIDDRVESVRVWTIPYSEKR